MKLAVHQGSVLNLFLFTVVIDGITKDVREGGIKELLYVDHLVLLGYSWEKVEMRYARWKKAMTEKRFESKCEKDKGFLYW